MARFAGRLASDHFREAAGLWLSSIGIGTYLGDPDEADDAGYRDSVVAAVRGGCNVIDSAINYRFQRSERSIGQALRLLAAEGFRREEIAVATKGGFIPFDGGYPTDMRYKSDCPKYRYLCALPAKDVELLLKIEPDRLPLEACQKYASLSRLR